MEERKEAQLGKIFQRYRLVIRTGKTFFQSKRFDFNRRFFKELYGYLD